jgi:hypothetical protein
MGVIGRLHHRQEETNQRKRHREDGMRKFYEGEIVFYGRQNGTV